MTKLKLVNLFSTLLLLGLLGAGSSRGAAGASGAYPFVSDQFVAGAGSETAWYALTLHGGDTPTTFDVTAGWEGLTLTEAPAEGFVLTSSGLSGNGSYTVEAGATVVLKFQFDLKSAPFAFRSFTYVDGRPIGGANIWLESSAGSKLYLPTVRN